MVPGSLCRLGWESELLRSMWGRLVASKPAGGERAGVSDGSGRMFSPFPGSAPQPPAPHPLPGTDLPRTPPPSLLSLGREALGAGALRGPPKYQGGFFPPFYPTCYATSEPQFPYLDNAAGRHPT